MNVADLIFWNVDTQIDFVSTSGKLYVPGAELLKPNWDKLTQLAKTYSVTVVNTADWHFPESDELAEKPDFIQTFPPHCMANSEGAGFIEETSPENPLIIDWEKEFSLSEISNHAGNVRNYIIRKDAFDVFKGNPFTGQILKMLSPNTVVVYGVTTNVCVNDAVVGLAERVPNVLVVEDAIRELPNIPLPFENWKNLGIRLIQLAEIESILLARHKRISD